MAPEVLMTYDLRDKYSFEADVWSLGVVLYVLMFLKYPFEGGKN
jgi:serine/threonine protein kinase